MGTKLYFTRNIASSSMPSVDSLNVGPWPKVNHPWSPSTDSVMRVMQTSSGTWPYDLVGSFNQSPTPHHTYVQSFISPPLLSNSDITNDIKIVSYQGMSRYEITKVWTYDEEHGHYWVTTTNSLELRPEAKIYLWRPSTATPVATISQASDSVPCATDSIAYHTYTIARPPYITVSALAGDRIVCDLYHLVGSAYGWTGYSSEYNSYNVEGMYLSVSATLSFGILVDNDFKSVYRIRKRISETDAFRYHLDYYVYRTSSSLKSNYSLSSYRYIQLYMETESTARGKASLKITPRASAGFDMGFGDYSQKWVNPFPTLNRFKMIDDFESYYNLDDAGGQWTVSDGLLTFSALKTFSAEDYSDYNVLTFYANSTNPTTIQTHFIDSYGNTSTDMYFFIDDRWQRYEKEVPWGSASNSSITKFEIIGTYDGDVIIDDIFMLDNTTEDENLDWTKLHLTKIDFGREAKMSTFQIPYKQAETIQFLGEKNGEGELRIRTFDTMQTEFLDNSMKMNHPLYIRYKNFGLPIVLKSSERDIFQVIPKQVSSEITIPFYEIYDYSMW